VKRHLKVFILWAIIGTGVSSIAVQLVTVREFLSQFHGNEITISLVLFSWLLLTGLEASWQRPFAGLPYRFLPLSPASCFVASPSAHPDPHLERKCFCAWGFTGIQSNGPIHPFDHSPLLPAARIHPSLCPEGAERAVGELHVRRPLCHRQHRGHHGWNPVQLCPRLLFHPLCDPRDHLSLLIVVVLLLFLAFRRYVVFFLTLVLTGLFCLFSLNSHFEKVTLSPQYGEIVRYVESPYGRIVITKEGPQHTFWESGTPFYSDADVVNSEEKIHYALSQLEEVRSVLLVSGVWGKRWQKWPSMPRLPWTTWNWIESYKGCAGARFNRSVPVSFHHP